MSRFHRARLVGPDTEPDLAPLAPMHQSAGYYRCTSDGVILSRRYETRQAAIEGRILGRRTDAVLLAEVEQHYAAMLQGRNIEVGTAHGAPLNPENLPAREERDLAIGVGYGVLLDDETRDTFKPFHLQFCALHEVYRFQRLRGLKQRKRTKG